MAKAPTAIRELTNIRPREVSLVDEAANLREFITIKNKGGEPMSGLKDSEILKSQEQPIIKVSAAVKKAAEESLQIALEKMMAITNSISKLEVGEGEEVAKQIPAEIISEGKSITSLLLKFITQYNENNNIEATKRSKTEDETLEIEPNLEGIEKAIAQLELEKAGKKMAAGRLEKLIAALDTLQSLKSELIGSQEVEATEKDNQSGSVDNNVSKATTNSVKEENMAEQNVNTASEPNTGKGQIERSEAEALTLAQAEVIKARDEMRDAEATGDAEKVNKAKARIETAETELKKAKSVIETKEKEEKIAKAQAAKEAAEAELKKAKGEVVEENQQDSKLDLILKSVQALTTKVESQGTEIEKMKSTAVAPAAQADDSSTENVNKSSKENVWAGIFG